MKYSLLEDVAEGYASTKSILWYDIIPYDIPDFVLNLENYKFLEPCHHIPI